MKAADYLKSFVDPDPRFTPVPAWWWSGEPLHWPKMKWQMERMRAMGLRNFVVIGLAPSNAMFGSDADEPAFLSEPWWAIFRQVCDHAKSLGMFVWFYDQIGFSGANFQTDLVAARPEWSGQRLKIVMVEGEGELTIACPAIGTPLAAYWTDDAETIGVEIVERSARFNAGRLGQLRIVYSIRQAYDYFNPDACQALLDTVHREFARRLPDHIGTTIVGSFQDELPELPTWGEHFADTFAEAFGYRLEPVLHRLFEAGDVDAKRTRVHFHQHRATLAETAFFKPFFDWHESHGMQCGYDQQSPAREARVIGCIDKYADYMRTQRWYALPGSDLHGNGKLHSSIALLNDRPRVWLEGFHTTGWGGTIADTFDWLLPYLQAGVTLYNPHAVYYSTRKGWWEWAPPSTCWRQPYAMHYAHFADTISRLTKLLSSGVHQATVGVLFPTMTAQSAIGPESHFAEADTADATFHEVIGSMRWHQVKTGALDSAAIDHHILDEESIQAATVEDGTFTVHGVSLCAIILPAVELVHAKTLGMLCAFAARGGRVVVIGSKSIAALDGRRHQWADSSGATILATAAELPDVLRDLPRAVAADVPFLHRQDGNVNLLFVPAVDGMATVVKWDSWFSPMEHTTIVAERYRDRVTVRVADRVNSVFRFDPTTGRTSLLGTTPGDGGSTINLRFDGAPMAVLVWSDEDNEPPVAAMIPPSVVKRMQDEWSCEYVPTLPAEFADIYDPDRPEQRLPTTPTVRWLRSDADHAAGLPLSAEIVRAAFGARGWIEFNDVRHEPLIYSPRFGIDHDPLHPLTLGPKGHVPEEFIDLGKMAAGSSATLHFGVVSDLDRDVLINIGTNARWHLTTTDGTADGGDDYNGFATVRLRHGPNRFRLRLTSRSNATTRAFWCLLDPADRADFVRPERLIPPTKPAFGQRLRITASFQLPKPIVGGTLFVATAAMSTISVNGRVLGRQGGFDPYRLQMRGQKYALPSLSAGELTVIIEMASPASLAPVSIDLEAVADDGIVMRHVSDASFTVQVDEASPVSAAVQQKQDADGAAWRLWRRPHPLPQTGWLDGVRPGVIDLPLLPPIDAPATQWFSWTIPPGATVVRVPLVDADHVSIWIDGTAVTWPSDGVVPLNGDSAAARTAVLRVSSRQLGGGVLAGPITYDFRAGRLRLGSWIEQGLASFSGAIRMRSTLQLDQATAAVTLDLGRVRGTVEAWISGVSLGVRVMSPYRFHLDGGLAAGEHVVELLVTNTLANHISTWSPTRCWSPDQLECGVFGPVTLAVQGSTGAR